LVLCDIAGVGFIEIFEVWFDMASVTDDVALVEFYEFFDSSLFLLLLIQELPPRWKSGIPHNWLNI
jgi:hypothetical protein